MSKVIEQPAATAVETPPATPQAPTLDDRIEALTGEALSNWRLKGNIEAAEALLKPAAKNESDVTLESSPEPAAKAGTEADSEPATTTHEEIETLEKPRGRDDWKALRSNYARIKAERDLLERQLAESRQSAPATSKVEPVPAKQPEAPKKPEFPDIDSYTDPKQYAAAVKKYEADTEAYFDWKMDQRLAAVKQETRTERQVETQELTWAQQVEAERKSVKDFDAVAFSDKVAASDVSIAVMRERKDGAKMAYYLGKNPQVAQKVAELTHIPGFKNYAELHAAASKSPSLAMKLGEVRALARIEFDRIAAELAKPNGSPKPAHVPPKPSSEVSVEPRAKPVGDEVQNAVANDDFETFKFLENKKAIDRERAGLR